MTTPLLDDLLTIREVAEALSMSTRHVRRLVASGELPAVRFGPQTQRIARTDLLDYVRRQNEHEEA